MASQYMLLLYESPDAFAGLSPEDMQKVIEKYSAWGDGLRDARRLVASHKLTDGEGRVLRSGESRGEVSAKPRVLDGPYSEAKEVVGGYFLIEAADWDEAVAVAGTCPHLAYGGTVEVRKIDRH